MPGLRSAPPPSLLLLLLLLVPTASPAGPGTSREELQPGTNRELQEFNPRSRPQLQEFYPGIRREVHPGTSRELPPGSRRAAAAARAALQYRNFQAGSPSELRALGQVRKATVKT
ncbi:hypothetical protein WISP_00381 [Willisornis vidua]|uniref:Cystatin LXN-type domain-containing protein n=1 Tax=Willisornis vidua TaxID=1566151 RepID=A0ABQ9DWA0_9PASS|nr:hypothetical protein WISP_00381 [Willisornis vidua]